MNWLRILRERVGRGTAPVVSPSVSTNYQQVQPDCARLNGNALRNSWQDPAIPQRQRAIVDEQLEIYRKGGAVAVFDALTDILASNIKCLKGSRLLEIGCSSGYYSEVCAIKQLGVHYEGCDYSPAFIELARRCYPNIRFEIQDATALAYGDSCFDIVVSGGCILHIPEYERAIAEAARVSRQWVVFHRTPVLHMRGPLFYTKKAYGVDTVEIHFHEQTLILLFRAHGMRVVDINTHSIGTEPGQHDALAMKTYLCEKSSAHG